MNPVEGRWYLVLVRNEDGCERWVLAQRDSNAAGGWTDGDCWEDWYEQVVAWREP